MGERRVGAGWAAPRANKRAAFVYPNRGMLAQAEGSKWLFKALRGVTPQSAIHISSNGRSVPHEIC